MKELTYEELQQAPTAIIAIYTTSMMGIPISGKIVLDAIEKYPDYFPEIIEKKRKWALVPQEVQDAYAEEAKQQFNEYLELFERKGILYYLDHPEEWNATLDSEKHRIYKQKETDLYNHYFGSYGLSR